MSCSHCKRTLPLSSFLANASADLGSRVFATCLHCRERSRSRRIVPGHLHNLSSLAQLQSQHILSPVLHGLPKWYLRLQWMLLCFARAAKKTLPLSFGSRVFATCLRCREQSRSKRRASQPLAPPRPPPQPLLSCPTSVATHQESRTPPPPGPLTPPATARPLGEPQPNLCRGYQ